MLLGLETFSYHLAYGAGVMDVFGFIQQTAELGLDGVQINIVQADWGHLGGGDPGHLREVRELIESLGLYVELDTRGTDPAHLRAAMAVCHAVGADVLRTYASLGGDLDEELGRAVTELRQAAPVCADLGVRIALENHEYETVAQIIGVIEAVGSEWVGALVDTGNSMMVWEDPVAAVRALAPYAVSSHFKDHIVALRDGEPRVVGVPLGRGTGACPECCRILAEESPLERINIESCYGYQAPFRRLESEGAGARLGEGAFVVQGPPFHESFVDPRFRGGSRPMDELLRLHDRAVVESVEYVKGLVASQAGGPG